MPWPPEAKHGFLRMQFEAQKQHYGSYYPDADHSIVITGETPVGRVYVDRQATEILIVDFTLLPEFHRRAIGRAVISKLQAEAASSGKILTGHVERWNPARVFWQRMGFDLAEEDEIRERISWSAGRDRLPELSP
jgi:GNAT superfamily N-acetyltransferase